MAEATRDHALSLKQKLKEAGIEVPPIGINRMVVLGGRLSITAEELSKGIAIGKMRRMVHKLLEFNKPNILDRENTEMIKGLMKDGVASLEEGSKYKPDANATSLQVMGDLHDEAKRKISEAQTRLHLISDMLNDSTLDISPVLRATSRDEIRTLGFSLLDQMTTLDPKKRDEMKLGITQITSEEPMDPAKISKGLGAKELRLPAFSQSNITNTANALYTFIKNAMGNPEESERLMAEPIRNVFFATESNSDHSCPDFMFAKKIACSQLIAEDAKLYGPVVDMLMHAEVQKLTFACVAGVSGVNNAISSISRNMLDGRSASALVIASDTAVYDDERAPGGEPTQGCATSLMWITTRPALMELTNGIGSEAFNISIPDFTKFGHPTPYVHGKLSTRQYVYVVGSVLVEIEKALHEANLSSEKDIYKWVLTHLPFVKQGIYFAGFGFAHYLSEYNPGLLAEIEKRPGVGKEPRVDGLGFVQMMEKKIKEFEGRREHEIIKMIEGDKDLEKWWKWAESLRSQPEFEAYLQRLHIRPALDLAAYVGNSYTSSIFVSVASLLKNAAQDLTGSYGVILGFGSGSQGIGRPGKIIATPQVVEDKLTIDIEATPIDHIQYLELHPALLRGDGFRLQTDEDLVEKSKVMLRGKKLRGPFNIVRMSSDTTGDYTYNNGSDKLEEVAIRHIAREEVAQPLMADGK